MSIHRPSVVLSLVSGGLLGLSPAASAVENAVEFQLAADVILDLVEERARFVDPGCPEIFDAGIPGFDQSILNHVSFGAPTLLREGTTTSLSFQDGTISAQRPRVKLPVVAHVKSVDCVDDPSCPTDQTLPVPLDLSFALTADPSQICATFTHSEGALPPEALDQVDAIASTFGSMCAPLSLGAVTGLLGDGVSVGDVALSANNALDRIAVRLDMNTPDGAAGSSLADWQTFMDGTLADAGTEDFSVHVDQAMLRNSFERQLSGGITCDASDPTSDGCTDGIEPTEDPSSLFSWWVPELIVGVDTDVEVWGCWDISTYLTLESPLSLSASGDAIETDAYIDWDPDEGEMFACSIVNPLFALALPAPVMFGVMEAIAANYSAANEIEGALPSECTMVDDHNIDCSFPFELPELDLGPGPDGILSATNLRGVPSGLVLEGDVAIVGATTDPQPMALAGGAPWYGLHGNECDAWIGYQGWLEVSGGPGTYCPDPDGGQPSPIVVGDIYDVYSLSDVDAGPYDGIGIGLGGSLLDTFWDDPYGLVVTVWSTVGSGSIALDKPIEQVGIDWQIIADYVDAYVLCHFTEQTGLFGIPGLFDFHWLVDPPPYELVAVGSVFDRAEATLLSASITQIGDLSKDEVSGAVLMPARSATLTTKWVVDAGRAGRFEFSADTPMTVDLGGVALFDGYAFTPGQAAEVKVDVPRDALPSDAREASVTVTLDPANVVLTGLEKR